MEVILEKKTKYCNVEQIMKQKIAQTLEIAKQVELMIIIGAKKSNTANQLYEMAINGCNNAMIVEDMEDLYLNYITRFKKIGVVAVNEAPKTMINDIVKKLKNTETGDYIYEHSRELERL